MTQRCNKQKYLHGIILTKSWDPLFLLHKGVNKTQVCSIVSIMTAGVVVYTVEFSAATANGRDTELRKISE